jgi:hypothetical protein
VGKKIGFFGFLRLACMSAKTKWAYLRVGFFSMLHNGSQLGDGGHFRSPFLPALINLY